MSLAKRFVPPFVLNACGGRLAGFTATRAVGTVAGARVAQRGMLGFGACVGAMLLTSGNVFCKPKDTPDYLLPYYLRDSRSRFNHYASIRKNGKRYMTPEDFLLSLLASPKKELDDKAAADDIKALFGVVDRNDDGKISFREYSVLMVLLATSLCDFELAFRMFDTENKGSLAPTEFQAMMQAFGDANSKPSHKGQIMRKLFGPNCDQRCTFSCFKTAVNDLHMEVTKAEFRQYDTKRQGTISSEHFGRLISDSMLGSHLPFFIVENIRKMKANATSVRFSTWASFSSIMRDADAIGEAIQLYTSADLPLRREDLNRAVSAVGLPKLSEQEVDLVFALFDKNNDGTLEYEEFISVMSSKVSFHVRPRMRSERQTLYARFVTCLGEALEPED